MFRYLTSVYSTGSLYCGLFLSAYAVPSPVSPASDAPCKQAVVHAYEQLSKQAIELARQPGPAVYRLRNETRFLAPGKKQESTVTRTITVAMQRGNSYYTDGTNEVYSNAKERVIIDREKRTILVISNHGEVAANDNFQKSMQFIRGQLLTAATVSTCSSQAVDGKAYKKVILTLPAAVQARTRIVTLTSLLTPNEELYQTAVSYAADEPVRQVTFTILPLGSAAAIRTVASPLSYIYRPDHTLQAEFTRYQLTDQRKQAR